MKNATRYSGTDFTWRIARLSLAGSTSVHPKQRRTYLHLKLVFRTSRAIFSQRPSDLQRELQDVLEAYPGHTSTGMPWSANPLSPGTEHKSLCTSSKKRLYTAGDEHKRRKDGKRMSWYVPYTAFPPTNSSMPFYTHNVLTASPQLPRCFPKPMYVTNT
jgi:hypothetical protein